MTLCTSSATMAAQNRAHTHNGFLAPPPERPGTPMRAPDTIDWLAEAVPLSGFAPAPEPPAPTATQRRRANAQLVTLGLCVGTAMGLWIGLIPAAALGRVTHGLAHGALPAYGISAVALIGALNLPNPEPLNLANGRVGDLSMAAGVIAGIAFQFARYGLLA